MCPLPLGSKYVQVFDDYAVTADDGEIDVRVMGGTPDDPTSITLTLEKHPKPGRSLRIIASGGDVSVDGNGHPIESGGSTLAFDSSHVFVFSCTPSAQDPSAGGKWILNDGSSSLSQATWFINAVTGSNANSGKTAGTALKTWAEWQKRVGEFTTLTPTGGVLRVNIMSDLPVTDPVTFRNFLAAGATAFITGREKVVKTVNSGTITYGARNRSVPAAGGTPFTLAASSLPGPSASAWDPYIRLMVKSSTGAKAYVLRNYTGSKNAHVSSWMEDIADTATPFSTPFQNPTAPPTFKDRPSNGTSFQILDFSLVTLGEMSVGYDFAQSLFKPDYGPPGGLTLENLHSDGDNGQGDYTFPRSLSSNETLIHTRNVIHDRLVEVPAGNKQNVWSNNLFTIGTLVMGGVELQIEGGAFRPYAGFADYPGGIRALPGSSITHDGDLSFVGDLTDPDAPQFADVQMFGTMSGGPISFWDSNHGFVVFQGGRVQFESQSPFFNNFGFAPLWGNGNVALIAMLAGGKITIEQFNVSPAPNPLPTLTFNGTNPANLSVMGVAGVDDNKANRWDRPAALYRSLIDTKWASLDVDVALADGFRDPGSAVFVFPDGTSTVRYAAMIRPEVDAHITRNETIFVPV